MICAASAVVEAKPKTDLVLIPGGKGKATHLKKGDLIKVINTNGKQVRNTTGNLCRTTSLCFRN